MKLPKTNDIVEDRETGVKYLVLKNEGRNGMWLGNFFVGSVFRGRRPRFKIVHRAKRRKPLIDCLD